MPDSHVKLLYLLEELLVAELGQYQHESGQVVPSIRVIPPPVPDTIDFVPESGIAAAIWKNPVETITSQGSATSSETWWKVFLAQRQTDESLYNATAKIKRLILSTKETTAMQEKTQFTIKYERAILLIPEWDDFDGQYLAGKKDYILNAFDSEEESGFLIG